MFDVSSISKRSFKVRLTSENEETGEIGELKVSLEPPKIKTLKKIVSLVNNARKEDAMEEMSEAVRLVVSKNQEGVKVPMEYVDNLDYDEMNELMNAFFEWLTSVKNSKN